MIKTILTVILIAICAMVAVIVMMQQGSEKGLGAISGISSQDTYWGKNKGRSKEGRLKKLTTILVIAFIGLSLFLNSAFVANLSSNQNNTESVTSTSTTSVSDISESTSVVSNSDTVK